MKKLLVVFISILGISQVYGKVVFGPVSPQIHCPSPGRGQTNGQVKYCIFDDPRVVQVIHSRCPSGIRGGSNTSIGNEQWCVIRK
jgi:hypothetical protein